MNDDLRAFALVALRSIMDSMHDPAVAKGIALDAQSSEMDPEDYISEMAMSQARAMIRADHAHDATCPKCGYVAP